MARGAPTDVYDGLAAVAQVKERRVPALTAARPGIGHRLQPVLRVPAARRREPGRRPILEGRRRQQVGIRQPAIGAGAGPVSDGLQSSLVP
jgi:hypothetical protein